MAPNRTPVSPDRTASARTVAGVTVYGKPGEYAGTLARRHRLRQLAFLAAGAGAAATAWVVRGWGLWPVAVLAVLSVALLSASSSSARRASRATVGRRSEERVVDALRASKLDVTVFCGLLLGGGGDADLVVVDRRGQVFVGEVKTVMGAVSARGETLLSNGRPLTTQPVGQVRRQVAALGRRGVPCAPFVVASQGKVPGRVLRAGGVPVMAAADVPSFLAAASAPWSSRALDVLVGLADAQGKRRR